MIELLNLGLSEQTINNMLELEPMIKDLSEKEILEKLFVLEKIGCSHTEIINIVSSNPAFFNKTNSDVIKLINCLYELGFKTLNILFDSNPYVLNLEPFEIKRYINKRKSYGEELVDIIDDLDSNPYLFNDL